MILIQNFRASFRLRDISLGLTHGSKPALQNSPVHLLSQLLHEYPAGQP
jgi:hypothetical protein